RLLADELVLAGRVEDLVQCLAFVDALAVAGRAGQEQDVAAVGQVLEDPVGPVLAVGREVGADPDVVVGAVLAAREDTVGDDLDAGLVGAAQRRQDGLAGVWEDDDRGDAFGGHALDVGDGFLGVALPVRVLEVGDVRALGDLVLGRRG